MATVTDVEVANQSFPNVRQDLNDILEAIATNFSADAEPTTTYANQWWYETDTNKLYIRNEDNDAWIHVLTLDQTTDTVSSVEGVSADKIEEGNSSVEVVDTGTGFIQINVDGSEAGRFDSSGNLLIGKTTTAGAFNTVGTELRSTGLVQSTVDGSKCFDANRITSDGDIIGFSKDGSSVGSIGTVSTALYVASPSGSDSGIRFDGAAINPCTTAGAYRDNAIDLGSTSAGFKDLYLDGGVYLGGTASANKLDDYEEGTWSPVVTPSSGAFNAITINSATYTKVGDTVYVYTRFTISDKGTGAGLEVGGLPFTAAAQLLGIFAETNLVGITGFMFNTGTGGTSFVARRADNWAGQPLANGSYTVQAHYRV